MRVISESRYSKFGLTDLIFLLNSSDNVLVWSSQCENGLDSAEDDHTVLSLVSVYSVIEGFIGE